MNITVYPSETKGIVVAPPSKSITQRAIAAGLLSSGTTVIHNPSFCNDSLAALRMVQALGASVVRDNFTVTLDSGKPPDSPLTLECG